MSKLRRKIESLLKKINKCGLFNIGGQGQMIIGGLFAGIFAAVLIPQTPILNSTLNSSPLIMIPTILIISMLFGAIWAGIPGLLRAYTGAHEVITTIFMNFHLKKS